MDKTAFIARTRFGISDKLTLIGVPIALWIMMAYFLYWLAPWGIQPEVDYTDPLSNGVAILMTIVISAVFFWSLWRNGSERLRLDAQGLHWSPPIGKWRSYRWDEIDVIRLVPSGFGSLMTDLAQGEEHPRPTYGVLLKKSLPGRYASLSRRTSKGDFFINGVKSDRPEEELIAALLHFSGGKFKG